MQPVRRISFTLTQPSGDKHIVCRICIRAEQISDRDYSTVQRTICIGDVVLLSSSTSDILCGKLLE